jgi:glycosyltransferase involved in cell wall biosynthesis
MLNKLRRVGERLFDTADTALQVSLARLSPAPAPAQTNRRRVTFVQYGDYAEGYRRLRAGGAENYYAQKYTVDFVDQLAAAPDIESVSVISVSGDQGAEDLPNGVHTLGIELYPKAKRPRVKELLRLVAATRPTHVIATTPNIRLIASCIRSGYCVLPMFADSFRAAGIKVRLDNWLLASLLNAKAIVLAANHNLAASKELQRIGVDPAKVVPFDWPALLTPEQYPAKLAPSAAAEFRLLYVGMVIETKGVGDAITAASILIRRGKKVRLSLVGRGDIDRFRALAHSLGIADNIELLGLRAHNEVVQMMRDADAVLVPSRWAYPEGLPMTLYEALCSRTPLVTSDHPMFALRIRADFSAVVFHQADPAGCAAAVERLMDSTELYARISANSAAAAEGYLCPLKYHQLIEGFLNSDDWPRLRQYSLANSEDRPAAVDARH